MPPNSTPGNELGTNSPHAQLSSPLPPPHRHRPTASQSASTPAAHPRNPLHPYYATRPDLWTRLFLHIQPDPVQSDLLNHPAHRLLLNCTRQWGKTTICAAKALHFALHHPRTTTLIAAPTARQSTLFLNKIRDFLSTLTIPLAPVPNLDRSILLPNHAQLISLPGRADNVRGFTAHLLIFDEAARIENNLFEALNPTLATTNGPLWLLSTPNGLDNIFYDLWHSDNATHLITSRDCKERSFESESESPYTRITVTCADCPRLTPEFLATQRLMLGEIIFRQEYHCEFLAGPHTMFSLELLQAAIDPSILPLFEHPLWN